MDTTRARKLNAGAFDILIGMAFLIITAGILTYWSTIYATPPNASQLPVIPANDPLTTAGSLMFVGSGIAFLFAGLRLIIQGMLLIVGSRPAPIKVELPSSFQSAGEQPPPESAPPPTPGAPPLQQAAPSPPPPSKDLCPFCGNELKPEDTYCPKCFQRRRNK